MLMNLGKGSVKDMDMDLGQGFLWKSMAWLERRWDKRKL